jgi:hypothetical protein
MEYFMGHMKTRKSAAVKELGMGFGIASPLEEMTHRARCRRQWSIGSGVRFIWVTLFIPFIYGNLFAVLEGGFMRLLAVQVPQGR